MRSAVEPVLGHVKTERRMGRNYLAGCGDLVRLFTSVSGSWCSPTGIRSTRRPSLRHILISSWRACCGGTV